MQKQALVYRRERALHGAAAVELERRRFEIRDSAFLQRFRRIGA
jgi:hypothetical protein